MTEELQELKHYNTNKLELDNVHIFNKETKLKLYSKHII